jgi:2,3-dihydroxybenzoate decarboxylase
LKVLLRCEQPEWLSFFLDYIKPQWRALFADIERRLADFDQLRLETMDKAGIDLAVLSVTTPGVQAESDAKTAIELARNANDLLAREVQKRPQRYAGFAHLPMQDAAAAAAELQRAVSTPAAMRGTHR